MKTFKTFSLLSLVFLLFVCSTKENSNINDDQVAAMVNINYNVIHQEIDGFGGSNAWTGLPQNSAAANEVVKLLYSKTEGAGFSILRNRIPFRERLAGDNNPEFNDDFVTLKSDNTYNFTDNGGVKTFKLNWNSWDLAGTKALISKIKSLGKNGPENLVVMSSPWTTPNNRVTQWKEDVTDAGAKNYAINWKTPDVWGRLKKDKYGDYADLLADYVKNFETKMGAPLAILSIQNEPNWKTNYESTYWNGTDIRDFLKTITDRFPLKGINPQTDIGIMIPEYENFDIDFNEMIKPSLDDPKSNSVISYIALHQYNGAYDSSGKAGAKSFPQIISSGKRFWQTEVSGSGPNMPAGTGIDNALFYAKMIHYDMTLTQINAFLFWWLWTNDGNNDFTGVLIKVDGSKVTASTRLYAMGQYSRFIRPGWNRIEADSSPSPEIYVSAYANTKTGEIAIVAINSGNSNAEITFNLEGAVFSSLDTWRTSENEKIASIGKASFENNKSTANLPKKSISTFYGNVEQ